MPASSSTERTHCASNSERASNAAGIAPRAPIERTDEELLDECFRVNAFGPAFLMIRAFPHMKARKSGCVVNVSTLGTTDPFPGFFAYAASKAALDSFTRSLAREGKAILVVSSELPELLGLCRRILVMRAGRLVGEIPRADATEAALMRLMAGVETDRAA